MLCCVHVRTQHHLQFGGDVSLGVLNMCLCMYCVKVCYLIFVYGFEKPNEDKLSVN